MRASRVALSLLLLVAVGCGDRRAGSQAPRGEEVPCPERGVVLWLNGAATALGGGSLRIEAYNCGDRVQVLQGLSRAWFSNVGGRHIRVVGSAPSGAVQVRPGEVFSAEIGWRAPKKGEKRLAEVGLLRVAAQPGRPVEELWDAGITMGADRKVTVVPWRKVRAAGAEVGDGAPHHADNRAWRTRLQLDAEGRLAGEMAARKIRPALERLRVEGGFDVASVRAALAATGVADRYTGVRQAGTGVAFEVYPGRGSCVYGTVRRERVAVTVAGVRVEGGCAEP
ncbi:DUF4232 domain-containing protein [Spirillospora sp. CA-253888]